MNPTYTLELCVRSSEVDHRFGLRPDHIATYLQDITDLHATEMGVDGKTLVNESNAFWILSKLKMKIHRMPQFGDLLTLTTWPHAVKGVRFLRDYTIQKDGQLMAACTSEWCILDICDQKLRKADSIRYPHGMIHCEEQSGAGSFLRTRETVTDADHHHTYRSSFVDIDTNQHTNNIAYLRMALNCFTPDEYETLSIDELQINFLSQTFYGDTLEIYKKRIDGGYFITGKLGDQAVFTCTILLKA